MSRETLILANNAIRDRAKVWIDKALPGTVVEFKDPKRTVAQNDRMYAMLTDISRQITHLGRRYDRYRWKAIFMQALGQEMEFLPTLDGDNFFPFGLRSSELSKGEMSELIEFIAAEGAKRGVIFHDPETERGAASADADSPEKEARINAPTLNTQPNRNKETIIT